MVFYQKEAAEIKHVIAQTIEIYAQIQVFVNGNMVPESLWHFFSISHQEKKDITNTIDGYLYWWFYPSVYLIIRKLSFSESVYVCEYKNTYFIYVYVCIDAYLTSTYYVTLQLEK